MLKLAMTNMERVWRLLVAANDEALRAGHTHVDADHVLLGLLVIDGESAAQLRSAGLTLDSARSAMAAMAREDLASIGVSDEGWAVPPPKRYAAEVLPFTGRATAAVKKLHRSEPDTVVLSALLTDSNGPASRLLGGLAIDVPGTAPAEPSSTATSPDWTGVIERTVPVAPERIWALLDDPLRRPEWDEDVATIEVVDPTTYRGIPRMMADEPRLSKAFGFDDAQTTYRLAERSPGALIAWRASFPGRGGLLRARRPYAEYLQVEIAPTSDGHSHLTLSMRAEREGRRRVLDRAFDKTITLRLNVIAQALAQAA